ncbi:DUF2147 domain-containing protein [Phenylobacterium sp.]|uniref:DUF2147 domain-containing protein n=1 Tax=Phenylobacterium sp. TaxID=1871053 RepID=UPI0030F381B8
MKAFEGDWAAEGLGGVVRLGACADDETKLCGRLLWVWDRSRVKEGMVGAEIMKGFVWRDGAWRGGTMVNPVNGETHKGSIRIGTGAARVSGCLGHWCEKQVWRALGPPPGP